MEKVEMGGEKDRWAGASVDARTCADGVGARERLGGEKDACCRFDFGFSGPALFLGAIPDRRAGHVEMMVNTSFLPL